MSATSATLNGKMTLSPEQIRIACQYPKRDNLRQIFGKHWNKTKFDWNEAHPADTMLPILQQLATPYPNKDQRVIIGATQLINKILSQGPEASPALPEASPAPGIVKGEAENKVVSFLTKMFRKEFSGFTELDLAYYFCIGATIYSLWFLVKDMTLFAGPVYLLLSRNALRMTKNRYSNRTAERGVILVWALEIAALFVHWNMFNLRLWQHSDIVAINPEENPAAFFWIAGAFATLLSGGGIYAVSTSLAANNEKAEAEEYEDLHGKKW